MKMSNYSLIEMRNYKVIFNYLYLDMNEKAKSLKEDSKLVKFSYNIISVQR